MTKSSDTEQSQVRKHWQDHVKTQQKSGLSRAEYCRQHDLSYYALTYWTKKISVPSEKQAQLVPVPVKLRTRQTTPPCTTGLRILLNDRFAIEVGDQFSPTTLRQVLTILEGR